MLILVISDLHGNLAAAHAAVDRFKPDLLLSCGDWGDPDEIDASALAPFSAGRTVLTTFGNHDPMATLEHWRNRDGTAVLIGQGEVRVVDGLRVAAVGGIWAKSHRLPHYVTDADVAAAAARIARAGPVDILLTHGCPIGLADQTPRGNHGGQRCFLEASKAIAPRFHLCGHLHVAQERTLKDGRRILNVGATPEGTVVVFEREGTELRARIERLAAST
jgi:Icc-related predicted phosphoesterase